MKKNKKLKYKIYSEPQTGDFKSVQGDLFLRCEFDGKLLTANGTYKELDNICGIILKDSKFGRVIITNYKEETIQQYEWFK